MAAAPSPNGPNEQDMPPVAGSWLTTSLQHSAVATTHRASCRVMQGEEKLGKALGSSPQWCKGHRSPPLHLTQREAQVCLLELSPAKGILWEVFMNCAVAEEQFQGMGSEVSISTRQHCHLADLPRLGS